MAQIFQGVNDGFTIGHEGVEIAVERPELLLYLHEYLRIRDSGLYLAAVPDDVRIGYQLFDVLRRKCSHFFIIKVGKSAAVAFAPSQDGYPTQSGLCRFEDEKFK